MTARDWLLAGADNIYMNGHAKRTYRRQSDGAVCILGSMGHGDALGCVEDSAQEAADLLESIVPRSNSHNSDVAVFNDCLSTTKEDAIQLMHDVARGVLAS